MTGDARRRRRRSDRVFLSIVAPVEDPTTPWLIAQASVSAGMSVTWAWLTLLLGALVVSAGGILIAVM
ncbi:hypothetical protein MOBUDSM44075_01736 [Mycolicibacterium obuense]|uniref:Uncharacterized protein n=1 Tax=Mycolicibacterium obuense TaxID=1807 RepID=A0A0J6W7J8_9MYCO|nr:hypothetical protein MOBUDSM44075_01736 [Mycolicibacterium obuense]